MPAIDLERCPICTYPLVGLPRAHHCPECGFAYNEDTLVYRLPRVPHRLPLALLAYLLLAAAVAWTQVHARGRIDLPAAGLLAVLVGFTLRTAQHLWWSRRRYVVVTQSGLAFGGPGWPRALRRTRLLPWTQIVGVAAKPPNRCTIWLKDHPLGAVRIRGLFVDEFELVSFASVVASAAGARLPPAPAAASVAASASAPPVTRP